MSFSILQVLENDQRHELAELNDEVVYIGREPPRGGIIVASKAVSREHAVFLRISGLWFFKDLGSSNGSWLNGQHASAGIPYLLRSSDTIQIADILLEFLGTNEGRQVVPSIIAFSRGDFFNEFYIPQVGKVLSVGGAKADLQLDVDMNDLPALVIEKRSDFVCAFPVANTNTIFRNGHQLTQLAQLKDRDIITVTPYSFIVNIPSKDGMDFIGADNQVKSDELRETFKGWDDIAKPVSQTLFGQSVESYEGKQDNADVPESDRTIVSDMRPSGRFGAQPAPVSDSASLLEERVVFVIGFLMVLVILCLVFWWVLR